MSHGKTGTVEHNKYIRVGCWHFLVLLCWKLLSETNSCRVLLYYGNTWALPHLMMASMYHKVASHRVLTGCHSRILAFGRWNPPLLEPNPDCDSKDEAVTAEMQLVGTETSVGNCDWKDFMDERGSLCLVTLCPVSGNASVTQAKGQEHYHNKAFVACWLLKNETKKRGKRRKEDWSVYWNFQTVGERGEKKNNYIPTSLKPKGMT